MFSQMLNISYFIYAISGQFSFSKKKNFTHTQTSGDQMSEETYIYIYISHDLYKLIWLAHTPIIPLFPFLVYHALLIKDMYFSFL